VSQTKAAEQLGVTSSTMYRWTGKGLLHPQKIGGKVLYRQSELDKLKGI
jgi:excisionase family DNA binding protein